MTINSKKTSKFKNYILLFQRASNILKEKKYSLLKRQKKKAYIIFISLFWGQTLIIVPEIPISKVPTLKFKKFEGIKT